jgi:uncharacterized membrane protein YqjE
MRSANGIHENGRRVADILAEMRAELVEFVQTRISMLRTEVSEKWKTAKVAIPLVGLAALSLGTAFLLLTGALVGLVVAAFPRNIYRWFFACIIVAFFWGVLGAAAAYFAKREFELKSMVPRRTLEVLKGDKLWIEADVRNRV